MKSHEHHIFIEQLLPLATRGLLPKNFYEPLVELSFFFRNLCSKNITIKELDELERQIPYTLCKLEMVFPPAFFDVMVHLVVHLAAEAKIGGPVCYRWMYPIERYLRTLKKYIRNRAQPEGCIAEGYLADECLTFCSRYMDDIDTKFNRKGRNDDVDDEEDEGALNSNIDVFKPLGRPLGQGAPLHLSFEECEQIHLYILLNCDALTDFVKEHKLLLEQENPRNVERRHKNQFTKWVYDRVHTLHDKGNIDEDTYNLVCCPSRVVRRYAGYIVNGFRFHTNDRCENRKTQNCGVMVRGDDVSDKEYFGVLKDVFKVLYPGGIHAFVFKCAWFDVQHLGRGYKVDDNGLISVNKRFSMKTEEVYVLESQVEQVFYIQDPKNQEWEFVIKTQPRDFYNMPTKDVDKGEDVDPYQQVDAIGSECESFRNRNDVFQVESLTTNTFVVEREPSVVKMVTKAFEEIGKDDDFINNGDIKYYDNTSGEEELFSESS